MRRLFTAATLVLALGLAFVAGGPARAQDGDGKARRAYTVFMVLWRGETEVEKGFRRHIAERNLPFNLVVRNIDRDTAKLPEIREEIKRTRPNLVYTWGTAVTLGIAGRFDSATPDRFVTATPIVFVMVTYPTASRLVPSILRPRPNITGVVPTVPLDSQIRAMQAYRPLRRLAVIYNALESNSVINVQELKKLSTRMDFELIERRVPLDKDGKPDPASLPRLVAELAVREPQFLYIGPDNFVGEHRNTIAEEAMRFGVPCFTSTELELFDGKALLGLVARYEAIGQLAGYMAERILIHGVSPDEIPIQRLTRFTYGVRMSVARRIGIYPPMNVLDYAEIIDERRK